MASVLQVLGGRVEAMAEAHEFARRYANVERSKGGDNDMDRAPAFKAFVPGVGGLLCVCVCLCTSTHVDYVFWFELFRLRSLHHAVATTYSSFMVGVVHGYSNGLAHNTSATHGCSERTLFFNFISTHIHGGRQGQRQGHSAGQGTQSTTCNLPWRCSCSTRPAQPHTADAGFSYVSWALHYC